MSNALRTIVRGAYDVQKLRIQTGNRVVANYKARLGQEPSHKEDEISPEGREILNAMRVKFRTLMEGVAVFPRPSGFEGDELIADYTELCLVAQWDELYRSENEHFRRIKSLLQTVPIYSEFLEAVKGIGPAMAGVIVSEFDVSKAKYPSSFWRYAGLDVGPDGQGRSRRKEHLVEVEYTDREGNPATRQSITFNPFLKTKLIGVLGPAFLKSRNATYSEIYNQYKARLEHHAVHQEKRKGHRHDMAIRYMVKQFLVELHMKWRELEGLPVSMPYDQAKLGYTHGRQ